MYRDVVLDHYRSPRGRKKLDRFDVANEGRNPVCGDEISLCLAFNGSVVKDVSANCRGCSISVASASMLAELLPGKSQEQVERILAAFKGMMHGEPLPKGMDIGDLDALQGVRKFPVRVKCALLAWMTLEDALRAYKEGRSIPAKPSTTEEPDGN
jgi:nitrogen fixation NifU-like protein